jgi:hypothetical protein
VQWLRLALPTRLQTQQDSVALCKPDVVPFGGRSFAGATVVGPLVRRAWWLRAESRVAARAHAEALPLELLQNSQLA